MRKTCSKVGNWDFELYDKERTGAKDEPDGIIYDDDKLDENWVRFF